MKRLAATINSFSFFAYTEKACIIFSFWHRALPFLTPPMTFADFEPWTYLGIPAPLSARLRLLPNYFIIKNIFMATCCSFCQTKYIWLHNSKASCSAISVILNFYIFICRRCYLHNISWYSITGYDILLCTKTRTD